jgi:uncharacterized protein (DUF1697 family)
MSPKDPPVGQRTAALLRAINVGGRNRISMPDLRRIFGELGHGDVETYLQSGNVVFSPADPKAKESAVQAAIEAAIEKDTGLAIDVMVRTHAELQAVLKRHPFGGRTDDHKQLHVSFLAGIPKVTTIEVPAGENAELEIHGRELYFYVPDGLGRSKLTSAYLDRRLGVKGTARNWRTVTELARLTES